MIRPWTRKALRRSTAHGSRSGRPGSASFAPVAKTHFADAVPHILFRADPDGRFVFLNSQFRELTGHDHDEAGTDQSWLSRLHPDDVNLLASEFASARSHGGEVRCRIRLRHADGSFRWMLVVARRPEGFGGAADWYGAVSDIDAEVVADKALRDLNSLQTRVDQQTAELVRTEARYASLFAVSKIAFAEQEMVDAAAILDELKREGVTDLRAHVAANPDVLTRCTAAVRTVAVNEACARMLGFDDVGGAVDRPVERTAEDIESVLLRQFEMIFYGWDNVEGRVVLIGSGGRRVPVFYSVTRLSDERQLSSLIDVSSQDRIEEMRLAVQDELARANRVATVGAFSASIAHELGQPVASVQMDVGTGLRWLTRDPPEVASAIRQLERIAVTVRRISTIVAHTRDQITVGKRQPQIVDLADLASDTCGLLEREMRMDGIHVSLECSPVVPVVLGDYVELQQVLINLMNNARDAMRDVGRGNRTIGVTVTAAGGQVDVSVSDSGSGIAEDALGKLFQPFFTTKAGGIGLGLQICLSTIQNLGGDLTARNREGGGAVFSFSLPEAPPGTAVRLNVIDANPTDGVGGLRAIANG